MQHHLDEDKESSRMAPPSRCACVIEAGWLTAAVAVPLAFNPLGCNVFELPKSLVTLLSGDHQAWGKNAQADWTWWEAVLQCGE
jgi:hypothetical protein